VRAAMNVKCFHTNKSSRVFIKSKTYFKFSAV
jgi:hypothetical protein